MTRFLSFFILTLHALGDLRRKLTLPATAALLTVVAGMVVTGVVVADLLSAQHISENSISTKVAATESLSSQAASSLPQDAAEKLPGDKLHKSATPTEKTNIASNLSTSTAETPTAAPASQSAQPSITPPLSGAGSTVQSPPSQEPAGSVQVVNAPPACEQGKLTIMIPEVDIKLSSALTGDGSLSWQWESRVDSGTAPVEPIISANGQGSQSVSTGMNTITIVGPGSSQPLLELSESDAYSYSVRFHVTAPFDISSDWISIPQATSGTACST